MLRLNLFLPFRKRADVGAVARLRRALGVLGPGWALSPARRIVQAASLVLFLVLFLYVGWPYGGRNYAETFAGRAFMPPEAFLAADPLVGVSAALAARAWAWSLGWACAVLIVCLLIPRGFCAYVCPLGTLIDLFDRAVGRRVKRLRLRRRGPWVHARHSLLAAVLTMAACGLLVSGFVAAIPLLMRGLTYALGPAQLGLMRGWHLVPPITWSQAVAIALLAGVLVLGLLGRRFWCRCVCPTGALFSLANVLRLTERKVTRACIKCGRCAEACAFDAVRADYGTRGGECTFCQDCGGACPVGAITFVPRWARIDEAERVPSVDGGVSRRWVLAACLASAPSAMAVRLASGLTTGRPPAQGLPVRPPGSLPEADFLRLCVSCGECMKVCPNNVLQPQGFRQGLEGLWTPCGALDWSGCDPTCNNCGQVCPTGAIRALPLEEKRACRMGLADVHENICLPHAQRADCRLCVDECAAAGYDAIEFRRVGTRLGPDGLPEPGSGYLAPVVLAERCVGCGLCQMRCHMVNVKRERLLDRTAIEVFAGEGRENRMATGSYVALRAEEARRQEAARRRDAPRASDDFYLPDFAK